MVDQGVVAGHIQLEIHNDGAAGRHRDGLDAFKRRYVDAAEHIDLVEDLADHMEGSRVIRPADAEENPHRLTDLGLEWMQLGQRADRAIQYEILRALVQKLLDAELRAAVLAVRDIGARLAKS